jgi:predicted transposase YbfD/YdcC
LPGHSRHAPGIARRRRRDRRPRRQRPPARSARDRRRRAVEARPTSPNPRARAKRPRQKTLFEDIQRLLDNPETVPDDMAQTVDGDHGRIETRRATFLHDVAWLAERHGFPGLQAVGKVTATREIDGKVTTPCRYFVLSKPLPAARFLDVVRAHWHVENRLHWVLDVIMGEDQSRARKDNGPENLARLRRFALNILRANQDKGSTRGKIKRAAWDEEFLLQLLAAA